VLPPWDDKLVISFHKYWDQPTLASLQSWVDKRDQWNVPLWLGETGENSNEWFRDVARNSELLNIGWAWWPWKKIGTIAGPTIVNKPASYQAILNYWNNTGARPSTNDALNGLLALAQATRYENCIVRRDVIDALIRSDTQGQTLPFTNHSVPGIIYAANYDLGRPGEAFLDQTTSNPYNSGDAYRNDAVDIESCSDVSPTIGYDVGWLDPGDWMKYSVATFPAGPFSISVRAAALSAGGSFHVEIGGSNVTGVINVPATGGWQSWGTLPPRAFTNSAPASSFHVVVDTSGFNLHRLQFSSLLAAAPAGLTALATPAEVALDWAAVSGATTYKIKRATTSGGTYAVIAAGITGTNFTDVAVTNGTTGYYVVTAVNSYGESAPSNEAIAFVPFPRLSVAVSSPHVLLSWSNAASVMTLRTTTSLVPPVAWLPVTNAASRGSDIWQIQWESADAVRFFRLSAE